MNTVAKPYLRFVQFPSPLPPSPLGLRRTGAGEGRVRGSGPRVRLALITFFIIITLALFSCNPASTPVGPGVPNNPNGNGSEGGAGGGGISGGGSGVAGGGGGVGEEAGSGSVGDDGGGGSGDGSAPGGEEGAVSGAQASIPMQSVKPEKTMVTASDSQSFVPVVGSDEAVPEESRSGEHQVLVSNTPIDNSEPVVMVPPFVREGGEGRSQVASAKKPKTERPDPPPSDKPRTLIAQIWEKVTVRINSFIACRGAPVCAPITWGSIPPFIVGRTHGSAPTFIPEANAQVDLPDNIEFPGGEEPSICDRVGVTCCPSEAGTLNPDGSFECPHPATNDNTLYVYLTDGRRVSDEPLVERPNTNVLYTREAPKDTIAGPWGRPVVLTNDKGVVIGEGNDGNFAVRGDFNDNYRTLDAMGVEELAFDSTSTQMAFRSPLLNIRTDILDFDPAGALGGVDNIADIRREALENTRSFSVLKYSGDGKLRFGREVEDTTIADAKRGRIYNAIDLSDGETIRFLEDVDGGGSIIHSKTITFDVDSDGTTLVLFRLPSGNYRINMVNQTVPPPAVRYVEAPEISGTHDFKDLVIYQNQIGPTAGRFLLVDASNNTVWHGRYFVDITDPRTDHFVTTSLEPAVNGISVGGNPQSIVIDGSKSKAYIVNRDSDSVSVIDLKDVAGVVLDRPAVSSTINLRNSIPGKEMVIRPNQVAMDVMGENLIIGAENLRSALVVPVP